jgi:hypothetical protein
MLVALEVLTVLVVAVAMALALAHALELPGKLRLTKAQYLAVQPIYYPGFTFGGLAEPLGILLTLVLVLVLPWGSVTFWLVGAAFLALIAMHGCYWLLTHPVNNFWLKGFKLEGAGRGFFAFDPLRQQAESGTPDWRALRDRWEYSHVLRAGLGLVALALLVTAVAL